MKLKKLVKNVIMAVCMISMVLRPLPVMAADTDLLETEEAEETEETEDGIAEFDNAFVGMLLKGAVPPANEINIEDFGGGLEINAENLSDYDGKTITGIAPAGANLVIKGVTVKLTIKDLTIDRTQEGSYNARYDAVKLQDGATLILTVEGDNKFLGDNSYGGAGICVAAGNTLIVSAESNGTLTAVGGNGRGGAAGIGAGNCGYDPNLAKNQYTPTVGTIDIQGGTIIAKGGVDFFFGNVALGSAGIGGSSMGEKGSGSISISGGSVIATGGEEGAGIGSGTNSYVGSISISGGSVTANAGYLGAAIGSGHNGDGSTKLSCGNISITGGNVIANGNIGYGHYYWENEGAIGFEGGSVTIAGDAVVAVNDGELNPHDGVVPGHVKKKYNLTVSVENPAYIAGTKSGHITIGYGEMAFSEDITFTLSNGKAVSNVEVETVLAGEQPVKVTIEGTVLEDKTILIGTETDIIYNGEKFDFSVTDVSEYITVRYNNGVLIIGGNGAVRVSMSDGVTSTTDSVVVDDEANVTLTLDNLTVDTTGKGRSPVQIGKEGASECKIIAVGKSELSRCDSNLATGAIEASDGSTLTIGGSGTLILKGMSGESGSYACEYYAGGIRAINATVVIEENPTLEISNDDGSIFSGILSKNITINGGKINTKASGRGQGIGIASDSASHTYDVKINGGTIYAEGGDLAAWVGAITNCGYTRAVISGGSINMNKLMKTENVGAFEACHPINPGEELLYCTIITVGKSDDNGKNTLSKKTKVTDLTIKDKGGNDYAYGIYEMYTDDAAKLYLWLPEGSKVSKVVTENGTYVGECITNTEITEKNSYPYRGNSFGTAAQTFAIEGAYAVIFSGSGTEEDPYEINNLDELNEFRDRVNAGETSICGILMSSLNNKSAEWTPIGTAENPYKGTFNGNGYNITNLKVAPDGDNRGFFGVVEKAHIMHLQIQGKVGAEDQSESLANYGMFAGKATDSVFEDCMSSNYSEIYGGQNAAGIAGWASNCTFKKCKNIAKICSYNSVCGIVFDAGNNCTVEDCLNIMPIEGYMFKKMAEGATMTNCHTIGGSSRKNCLSIVRKYNNCTFVEEDADYYVHESYTCYQKNGTVVTDDWRDRKIAYILQGDRDELVWEQNDINYPEIHRFGAANSYRVYSVTTYLTCDKSDTPTVTYTNVMPSVSLVVPAHDFTGEVECAAALKKAGTCMDNAIYYYSCANCNTVETGNETHTFIGNKDTNNHVGKTEIRDAVEAVHATQTDGYTGDTYCLECNAKISDGTVIKVTPHEASEWKHNESEHWKECTVKNCKIEISESRGTHSSTDSHVATCQKKAVCDVCGMEYGETIPCSFTAKVMSEETLKTPATETEDAVYYYSCSVCGKVATDDAYTFTDHHEPEINPSDDDEETPKENENTPSEENPTEGRRDDSSTDENADAADDNTKTGTDVDANAGTGTNADTDTNVNVDVNTKADTNTNSDTDTNTDANVSSDDSGDEKTQDDTKSDAGSKDKKADSSEIATKNNTENNVAIEEDKSVDEKKDAMKPVVIVVSAVAGTGAVSAGIYFFLKNRKLIEETLKRLFKRN